MHTTSPRQSRVRPAVEALEDRTVPTAMVAITSQNELFLFDSATPSQGQRVPIQGLASGDYLRGIDTGTDADVLFALTSNFNVADEHYLYRIDVRNGQAVRLTQQSLAVPDGGFPDADVDFNPATGELRVVTKGVTVREEAFEYRINVTTFDVAVDPQLKDENDQPNMNIGALAAMPSGGRPMLIDVGTDRVAWLEPSTGRVTQSGLLQVNADSASLDVAPDGSAYALLGTFGNSPRLYVVNPAQGNATQIGAIGDGTLQGTPTEIAVRAAAGTVILPPHAQQASTPPPVLGDVTAMVEAVAVKVSAKKGSKKRTERWTFTNNGQSPLLGPLSLILERLNGKTRLLNQSGAVRKAKDRVEPFVTWRGGVLNPGQSVTFTLEFQADGSPRYGWRLVAGAS